MVSACGGLAFALSSLLKLSSYESFVMPLPVLLCAARNGGAAGRKAVRATFVLLAGAPPPGPPCLEKYPWSPLLSYPTLFLLGKGRGPDHTLLRVRLQVGQVRAPENLNACAASAGCRGARSGGRAALACTQLMYRIRCWMGMNLKLIRCATGLRTTALWAPAAAQGQQRPPGRPRTRGRSWPAAWDPAWP